MQTPIGHGVTPGVHHTMDIGLTWMAGNSALGLTEMTSMVSVSIQYVMSNGITAGAIIIAYPMVVIMLQ